MIPLHDDVPTRTTPFVTVGIIAVCVLVFLWQLSLSPYEQQRVAYALGVVPSVLLGSRSLPPEVAMIPPEATIVTAMFLHGGWLHLGGNMLYFWIFGNNVEDAVGHVRFLAFYLLSGTAAAFAQTWAAPTSTVPMIGASGAIAGVLGAYLLLHPRANVLVVIPLFFIWPIVRIPAVWVLGIWFVLQFLSSAAQPPDAGGVAYWAHIGGFLTGMLLILVMRRAGYPLFDGARGPRRGPPRRGPWG